MQIRDVMSNKVELIDPTTTIHDAARMMRDDDIGILPIAENDKLVGVVTDRDIVVRTLAEGKDPTTTTVREAMSRRVLYCFDDQSVDEVADNMGEKQVRRLPVLNRNKRLVGIVSLGDLSLGGVRKAADALEHISARAH